MALHIICQSNASLNDYPTNKNNNFKNKLHNKVEFPGSWEVGLESILFKSANSCIKEDVEFAIVTSEVDELKPEASVKYWFSDEDLTEEERYYIYNRYYTLELTQRELEIFGEYVPIVLPQPGILFPKIITAPSDLVGKPIPKTDLKFIPKMPTIPGGGLPEVPFVFPFLIPRLFVPGVPYPALPSYAPSENVPPGENVVVGADNPKYRLRITGYTKVVVKQKDCPTIERLFEVINKQIQFCFGNNENWNPGTTCYIQLRNWNDITARIQSTLELKYYLVCKSAHLLNEVLQFGIAYDISKVEPKKRMYNVLIDEYKFSHPFERVFYPVTRIGKVQSNLIDHRYDGNRFSQVMDYIDVRSLSKVNNAFQVYHIPSVNYHQLVDDKIENIHIEVLDEDNEYINMVDGVTVVILKFRRVN